ncbi:hypothetical protein ACHAW5_006408 [Stephanodiscus triporus]|uniref:Ras-related GTP-binding protein n=1 Tax=Stephanodiscus triporus TaxID=2934178 RepID=A0ABD3NXL2_9STRA
MDAYYPSVNQYYDDDDDGESISSGSNDRNNGVIAGGGGMAWGRDGSGGGVHSMMGHRPDDGGGGGVPKVAAGLNDDDDDEDNFMTGFRGTGGGSGGGNGNGNSNNNNNNNGGSSANVVDFDDPRISSLPRILLMGPRRAGKTSIQRVVFHKMSPHETLFRLESTQTLERAVVDHTPLCRFTIWDFPGEQYEYGGGGHHAMGGGGIGGGIGGGVGIDKDVDADGYPVEIGADVDGNDSDNALRQQQQQLHRSNGDDQIFARATALIFVLDAQDEPYDHVLQSFTDTVTRAVRANPGIAVEVFVHKVDGELFLSDEAKYDCRRDVMQQVADELADAGLGHDAIPISYHLTSIYDHSVFEAFSRVVQRLIPELPTLEHLLNVLVSTCSMEKAYLFDVASKLYISTDSSPVDMQSVELCSDMIDVVLDVSGIYGSWGGGKRNNNAAIGSTPPTTRRRPSSSSLENGAAEDSDELRPGGETSAGDAKHKANEISGGDDDDDDDDDGLMGHDANDDDGDGEDDELLGKLVGHNQSPPFVEDDAGSAYDSESSSTIYLSNGMVLYLKEVDTMLALVCLTRAENFRKKSLINYNIGCLKKALMALPQSAKEVSEG